MNLVLPFFLSLSLTVMPSAHIHDRQLASKDLEACQTAIRAAEKEHGILPELLGAVAHVESGRMHPKLKKKTAWPWTICHKGKGHFFPTKEAALKKIAQLKKAGAKDFDVGLLQVNNYWHADAFDSHEDALDPQKNAQYAAKFLKELYNKHKSWTRAVSNYHSGNPKYGTKYCQRVMTAWNKGKQQKSVDIIKKNRKRIELKKRKRKASKQYV